MAFVYGFNVGPIRVGVNLSLVGTTKMHALGSIAYNDKGKKFRYVLAAGTIGLGNYIKAAHADDPYGAVVIGDASAAATHVLGMAPVALASGQYAWILEDGVFEDDAQIVSANVVAGQPLHVDANGDGDIAAATDITNTTGTVLVDDTDNTGTVFVRAS